MSSSKEPLSSVGQAPLSEVFARYLQRQAASHAAGFGVAETLGEVVPHDAAPAQPVDARLAWDESVAVLRVFQPDVSVHGLQRPPDWSGLVTAQQPATSIAFCVGNFPQLVRNLHALIHSTDWKAAQSPQGSQLAFPGLLEWAAESRRNPRFPQLLVTIGVLRLARQFEQCQDLLERHKAAVPQSWQAAWANEEAALAWHSGRVDSAVGLWQTQQPSAPVYFNQGMAALFLDRAADARPLLQKAVAELSDGDGWHHLGQLYLAMAGMRR